MENKETKGLLSCLLNKAKSFVLKKYHLYFFTFALIALLLLLFGCKL